MIKGTSRLRCGLCGFVLYRNPIVGVAAIVMEKGSVLLGKRRPGGPWGDKWCIPCGYVEWGEDIREAAQREFLEETGLRVKIGKLFAVHSNFHNQSFLTVGIWFRAEVIGGVLQAGDDLTQAGYLPLDGIPGPLAFPTDLLVLEELRTEPMLD